MFTIREILHAGLLVDDTDRSLKFYQGVLGLELEATRPDLGYPGAWLRVGQQQLHLLELPNPDPVAAHGGRDRHLALRIADIDELCRALDAAGIAYSQSKSGRRALFCRDPDGNALEFIEQS